MRSLRPDREMRAPVRVARAGKRSGGSALSRRRPLPRNWRLALQLGGGALALALLGGGIAWMSVSGFAARQAEAVGNGLVAVSAEAGFVVNRVLADGRNQTSSAEILRALDVNIGFPIFGIDLDAARKRVAALPWVESVTIERRLPDLLYIRITEAEPMALWQHDRQLRLLSRKGAVIAEPQPLRFAKLPLVVGAGAPEHTAELLAMLATQPELQAQVKAAVRVGERRWNLRLANGCDVKLPEERPAAAWAELARLEREFGILERDLSVIDLRVPAQLLVRLAPTAVTREKGDGNDT
ncbi:MAG TPA: cell division protein FtsQ/DivIB [Dongiaceae bacterium]